MLPEWLFKDDFIWRELFKTSLSVAISLLLILLGRTILFRRDRRIRELDRRRDLLDELRNEFVEIDNEYYKVRKRYETVHDAFHGDTGRNPYITKLPMKRDEVMDNLLVTCIGLEARYYTLMERLKVSLPELWNDSLKALMERPEKKEKDNLEYYFDQIRDCIEDGEDIDRSIKTPIASKFELILAAFDDCESQLLAQSSKGLRLRDKRSRPAALLQGSRDSSPPKN
ncbi:MAG TPA: hypothetical protein VN256_26575 [Pyrinomonadaceae bacterium]|nr:hypothetical protein [Pyrinomonadaceae bacterium]